MNPVEKIFLLLFIFFCANYILVAQSRDVVGFVVIMFALFCFGFGFVFLGDKWK